MAQKESTKVHDVAQVGRKCVAGILFWGAGDERTDMRRAIEIPNIQVGEAIYLRDASAKVIRVEVSKQVTSEPGEIIRAGEQNIPPCAIP
jgi:hypothetical protein